ncbi:MAG: T9SS type A sorting domain-containing protein, partial [Candidatus Zixiibacteriota bacterium]
ASNVLLRVYNVRGQLVETLVNEFKSAGSYSVSWNAEEVSSGIYFYCIIASEFTDVRKCIILK